jgi:predicted nucleic acid-binding protein
MKKGDYVLDACATLAYLMGEPGGETVHGLLKDASQGKCRVLMHRLNALEVYYNLLRQDGEAVADQARMIMAELPVVFTDSLEDQIFREAGRLKASYKLSLADAVALALAKARRARLVTSDHHEFGPLEQAGEGDFLWFR